MVFCVENNAKDAKDFPEVTENVLLISSSIGRRIAKGIYWDLKIMHLLSKTVLEMQPSPSQHPPPPTPRPLQHTQMHVYTCPGETF